MFAVLMTGCASGKQETAANDTAGGFDAERVAAFEEMGVPVDTYAVGSSFFDGNINYTADIVKVDGKDCAKAGRKYNPNPKMELVK